MASAGWSHREPPSCVSHDDGGSDVAAAELSSCALDAEDVGETEPPLQAVEAEVRTLGGSASLLTERATTRSPVASGLSPACLSRAMAAASCWSCLPSSPGAPTNSVLKRLILRGRVARKAGRVSLGVE